MKSFRTRDNSTKFSAYEYHVLNYMIMVPEMKVTEKSGRLMYSTLCSNTQVGV